MQGQRLRSEVIDQLLRRCGVHHSVPFALNHQYRYCFRPALWQALAARQKLKILLQPLTLHRDPNWGHALITPTVLSVVQEWLGAL